ncbi:MAG TPA: tripartite tricarboxylate transporter TctB family protein [Burkholderiales bacterium]|nr:tripartite tricarboxylate transporter TctB family protein [Burkholderiales bacterium]
MQASSAERLYGFGWALFGAAVLVASWRMDRLESLNINPWSAPGLMPGVLGALMVLFGLALAVRAPSEAQPEGAGSWRRTALALVLCFIFAAGLLGHGLPFWLTSAAFMLIAILAFRVMDGEALRWRLAASSAAIAIVAALVISHVFEDLFLVRLP